MTKPEFASVLTAIPNTAVVDVVVAHDQGHYWIQFFSPVIGVADVLFSALPSGFRARVDAANGGWVKVEWPT